jgi:hypothetical protein
VFYLTADHRLLRDAVSGFVIGRSIAKTHRTS